MPVLRTSYEKYYPDRGFYSVERTGFVTVGELMQQVVNDLLYTGAFARPEEVGTVFYSETGSTASITGTWPIQERQYTLASRGTGYDPGDFLIMADNDSTPVRRFAIRVNSVDPVDGKILTWQRIPGPKYSTISTTQPVKMVYSTGASLSAIPSPNDPVGVESSTERNGTFLSLQGVVATTGNVPVVRTTLTTGQTSAWAAAWSTSAGFGPLGEGGALGSTWPSNPGSIWCFADQFTANVKVGQEIFVDPATANAATVIPPGTTITKKISFRVINRVTVNGYGQASESQGTSAGAFSSTPNAVYFTLSNVVTLGKGETISTRGTGATFYNNETAIPDEWSVILETKGAGDVLSDGEPILANVHSSSGNTLIVKGMTTRNPYYPEVYPGMRLTSQLLNGTVSGYAYVKDIIKANVGWTKMTLTSNQTITSNEGVKFTWDNLQPWRLRIRVRSPQIAEMYTGTELQIPVGGKYSYLWNDGGNAIVDIAGLIGAAPTSKGKKLVNDDNTTTAIDTVEVNANIITEGFINRTIRVGASADPSKWAGNPESYPINYTLTVSRRGIFFGIWESSWSVIQKKKTDKDVFFNWVVIQRPVDRVTGRILTSGRCPVFCVNSVGSKYWKFVVRESDILHPTVGDPNLKFYTWDTTKGNIQVGSSTYRVPADQHSQDSFAIINTTNQIALTEDSKFLISFLHNLTTPRFRYSEELDLIGQTSADVCMATNDISIQAYKESGPRIYRAMPANNEYNTGLRVAVLKDLPDIVDSPVLP